MILRVQKRLFIFLKTPEIFYSPKIDKLLFKLMLTGFNFLKKKRKSLKMDGKTENHF